MQLGGIHDDAYVNVTGDDMSGPLQIATASQNTPPLAVEDLDFGDAITVDAADNGIRIDAVDDGINVTTNSANQSFGVRATNDGSGGAYFGRSAQDGFVTAFFFADGIGASGIQSLATADTGGGIGVFATSDGNSGKAVFARANSQTGNTIGVDSESRSTSGKGIRGRATSTSGVTIGVEGVTSSGTGKGVFGNASNSSGNAVGVDGRSRGSSGTGVLGRATNTSGNGVGVHGTTFGANGIGVLAEVDLSAGNGDTTALIANHRGSSGLIARFQSNNSNVYAISKTGNATLLGNHFASNHVNTSDRRLKEDITPVEDVLPRLEDIRSVRFRFRDRGDGPSDYHVGLLAQEVQAAFPELVEERPDGYLGVSYGHLTAVLLQAIKEQQRMIDAQQAQIDRLLGVQAETERRGGHANLPDAD